MLNASLRTADAFPVVASLPLEFHAWHTRHIDSSPVFVHAKSLVLRFSSEDVCGRVIEIK